MEEEELVSVTAVEVAADAREEEEDAEEGRPAG